MAVLLGVLPCLLADAAVIRAGEWNGLLDFDVSYGALWRNEKPEAGLIALASGGRRPDSNVDDGTLNFERGLASSMLRANGQLTLFRGAFSVFVRGSAYYDYEIEDKNRARTPLSDRAREELGKDVMLREAFVSYQFLARDLPVSLRIGDQVLNWGTSTFIRDGIDIVNPVDLTAALQPATLARDAVVPVGMVWGAVNLSESISVEGFYEYDWEPVPLPPIGSMFSPSDIFGAGEAGRFTLGGGLVSDLGTDLDDTFGLPAGTLGFERSFMQIPGRGIVEPGESGQWGLSLQSVLSGANALSLGLNYVHYNSRLPVFSGITGSPTAVAATSPAAVAARAAELVPGYLSQGLSNPEAELAATATAAQLALSDYANAAGFRAVYPKGVDMIGLTFSTATLRTGTLVSGEISHHRGAPFQIALGTVFAAVLSPVAVDPNSDDTGLGAFGPDETVDGYVKLNRTQATLGLTKLFSGLLGASQVALSADMAWVHVHDMPGAHAPPLQAATPPTADSYGYRLVATARYQGVFGSATLSPRILFAHDFHGTTPAPHGTFVEGRKALTVGAGVNIINRVTVDLDFTRFFGAGDANLLRDRDFARFRVSYWL